MRRRSRGETAVPKKLYYRIGEACRAVDIQPYVLRYWETEFDALAPGKSKSGQRVYTEQELGVIRRIKELLYEEGYTIAGAKKRLAAELEDGRSFAAPEADGELFGAEGDGGDELPVIAVEPAIAESEAISPERDAVAREGEAISRESEVVSTERAAASPESETGSAESEASASPAPPEVTEVAPGPRRRRGRSASRAAATGAASAEPGAESAATLSSSPAGEPETRAVAVDSARSDRVETLEHGLRRVLAEVRHLRDLLGDSGGDR